MEFKGTKGKWNIITKGNTVKQLCIQVDDNNKICGNISPYRQHDAQLIAHAPEMLEMLIRVVKEHETDSRAWSTILEIKDLLTRATTI